MDNSNPNIWTLLQPWLAKLAKQGLQTIGATLAAHGYITTGATGTEAFTGAGMVLLGLLWDWWAASGYIQAAALLKKLTATHKAGDALAVAKAMLPAAVTGAADAAKAETGVVAPAPANASPSASGTALKGLVLALGMGVALFSIVPSAFAQSKAIKLPFDPLHLNGTAVTGNATKDIAALWAKIVAASTADLQYASAMAGAAGTPASATRKQCWDAIIKLNMAAQGANLKNPDGTLLVKPDAHLISDVETLAEVVDNLSTQGDLFNQCAGAAQLTKMSALQFVATALAGATAFTAIPVLP